MKDRLLGMSLSYNRVRDSLIDPLVREEVFLQGDPAFARYVTDGDMPFQITSVSGFEPTRNVVENTSPSRIQDRELTIYIRARAGVNPESILRRYLEATNTESYSLNAQDGVFYVPTLSGGRGMVYLNLYMGNGEPTDTRRYQAMVSIKSLTGDLFAPSNDIYILVLTMHDSSFIGYQTPHRVEWDIPYYGGFVSADGSTPYTLAELPIHRFDDGITDGRLSRPRITVEMTAVETTKSATQAVTIYGYYSNPTETPGLTYAKHHNKLFVSMVGRIGILPTDNYLNVGEKATLTIYDPFAASTVAKAPRYPWGSSEAFYFPRHETSNSTRGFEHMNFPISDGATAKIFTQAAFGGVPGSKSAADVKITFDFFDQMTGVVL